MSDELFYIPIFRASSETEASIVKALLEGENIPVQVESAQVAMYDSIMVNAEGYWGDLLVPDSMAGQARDILRAYKPEDEEIQ